MQPIPDIGLQSQALELEEQAHRVQSTRYCPHVPAPRQQMFIDLQCEEALFGGQAYGGKSDALLMDALQYVDVPGYAALILRRTYTDLSLPGALMDRAAQWLRGTPARWQGYSKTWVFPTGYKRPATITFGFLENENDKFRYASAEFQQIDFDELTQFEEEQYRFLFTRLRRPKMPCVICGDPEMELELRLLNGAWQWEHAYEPKEPHVAEPDAVILREYPPSKLRPELDIFRVPLKMRSGTNPGGIGAEWVKARFIPDDFRPEDAAEARVREKDVVDELDDEVEFTTHTYFLPSRKEDNPYADSRRYALMLKRADRITRKQLGEGDWSITAIGRPWFTHAAIDLFQKRNPAVGELHESTNDFGEVKWLYKQIPNGLLAVWVPPQPGHRYVIGPDTASGRDRNRGKTTKVHADYSVAPIYDVDTHEIVARFRGQVSQRHFGEYWYRLHKWYNLAYVVPAVTGGYGQASLDRAMDLGLPIEFVYVTRDKRKPDAPVKDSEGGLLLGFVESPTARLPFYSALDVAITSHDFEVYDAVTINELYTFEIDKDGQPRARAGCHDDCVTGLALIIEGLPFAPFRLWAQANQPKTPLQVRKYGLKPGETERDRQRREMQRRIKARG